MNEDTSLKHLLDFLVRLDSSSLHYTLSNPTDRAIMVTVVVPGERWEIEFFEDRAAAVEVFSSPGLIAGPERIADLFDRFAE